MTTLIEPIALWLADFYLAATLLLAAAAAVFALVKRPSLRMAVAWGIVPGLLLAALLCQSASRPRLGLWSTPPVERSDTVLQTSVSPAPAAPIITEADAPSIDEPGRFRMERFDPAAVVVEQSGHIASPPVPADNEPGRPAWVSRLIAGLVCTFLAGSLLMATWLAVGVWRASRLVRESEPAPQACVDELHALVGAAARPSRLRVNRRLLTPVATGTLWPAILLPEESSHSICPHELRAVLAHEWTHIKNGDLWLLALDRIVLALLWAHPLYWWTRRRIRTDQEFLADAAAASQIGAAEYAAILVQWARKVTAQRSLTALTTVGIWERPAGLAERVTALLAGSEATQLRTSGRTRVGVAALLALMSLFAATISLRPPQADIARAAEKSEAGKGSSTALQAPAVALAETAAPIEAPRNDALQYDVEGTCRDRDGKPLAGVQVFLYAIQQATGREQLVREGTTNAQGRFRFPDCLGKKAVQLSWQVTDEDGAAFEVFARRAGLGTGVKTVRERGQQLEFTLTKAATLTGTVRDRQGRPIAGALVRDMSVPLPKRGWLTARSDAQGNFAITDLAEYQYAGPDGPGPPLGLLRIEHPACGVAQVSYKRVPGQVDLVLGKGATIAGTVVNGDTGKPAAGIFVWANWIDQPVPFVAVDLPFAKTDQNGRYQIGRLPQGKFNLCASAESPDRILKKTSDTGWVPTSIDSFETREGQTATAPPIRLIKGGVVKGRLYQYRPGVNGVHDPVRLKNGERVQVIVFHGPSLPAPGVVAEMALVKPDGTFEMRLPPGLHYLELPNSQKPDGTYRLPYCDMGEPCTEQDVAEPQASGFHRIKIREGDTTEIEISVFRPAPPKKKKAGDKTTQNVKPASPEVADLQKADAEKIADYHVAKDEIGGLCLGRGETRLSGVDVSLYLESFLRRGARKHDLLGQTATNEQGQFLFTHVRPLDSGEMRSDERYVIIARRKGLATEASNLNHSHDWVDLKMAVAVPQRGTVKDEQGKPVVGALVRCNDNAWRSLSEGVHSARTDAQGQFQIDDVADLWGCVVEHPDYPAKVLYGESTFKPWDGSHFSSDVIKFPLNITLVKGSVVEGQVVDTVTGRPGVGLTVTMWAIQKPYIGRRFFFAKDPCLFSAETQTDNNGHYRFTRLPAGRFVVYLTSDVPGRASIALDSLEVPAGTAVHASDIRLVKGGIVRGRLIDDQSGQPARLGEDEQATITVDGPARPRQEFQAYSQPQSFPVERDGTFELRLPPGKNLVHVSGRPYFAEKPADRNANQDIREIEIKEGQEATLKFRVVRIMPMKRQSAGVTSKSSSSADAGGAKPEWFHVRGADIGGIWSDTAGHGIAGGKVTLLSTDSDGSKRKVLKATTTNSWGQFLFVCAPCLAGPNQHYELVLSRDGEPPDVRNLVQPGKWLELRALRQVPTEKAPEKTGEKTQRPATGAANRPAPAADAPSDSLKIDEVVVEGNVTIPTPAILQRLKTQPGRKASPSQIQDDLRMPITRRWFTPSEPKYRPTDTKLTPVLSVFERPIVRSVEYLGASQIKVKKLAEETGLKVGSPYDMSVNKDAARRVADHYHEQGYTEATVDLITGDKPEERDVVFRIHEGAKQLVFERSFVGNTSVSGERLAMELKNAPAYVFSGGKFNPTNLAEDVAGVRKYYENLGFFDATVKPTVEYSKDRKWIYLKYTIHEGLHYKIRNFAMMGNARFKTEELLKTIKTHEGEYYNAFQIKKDIEKIKKKYDVLGDTDMIVEMVPPYLEQPGQIDLLLRVDQRDREIVGMTDRSVPELRQLIDLRKGAVLEGQVTDGETGQPAAGVLVTLQELSSSGEMFAPRGPRAHTHGQTATTDSKGRYRFRTLGPGKFNLSVRGGAGGVGSAGIDSLSVGQEQTVEAPPLRLAKGATVGVRLIDNITRAFLTMDADETIAIGVRPADGGSGDAKVQTLHMRRDGTIQVWLPPGKHAVFIAGGPFFAIGDAAEGIGHDVREIDVKGGEEPTVNFRVVRIAPTR